MTEVPRGEDREEEKRFSKLYFTTPRLLDSTQKPSNLTPPLTPYYAISKSYPVFPAMPMSTK